MMNKKIFYSCVMGLSSWMFFACCPANQDSCSVGDLAQYADPFIGTAYVGHTHPAAQVPFGMVQLGPDTNTDKWENCSGYCDADQTIIGFSHTHLSGTGCPDMGDIMVMPVVGEVSFDRGEEGNTTTGYRSKFSHATEEAHPGYYKVQLDDYAIKAELTTSSRVGFHKYTYPAAEKAGMVVDLWHGIGDTTIESSIRILDKTTIVGNRRSKGFAPNHNYYFYMKLSKPMDSFQTWQDGKVSDAADAKGEFTKAQIYFSTKQDEVVYAKVALSTVSPENAQKNMEQEIPAWDFDATRQAATKEWNNIMSRVTIEPVNKDQMVAFYTSMYHALIMPNIITDVDGTYRLPNGNLIADNKGDKYINFSLWDTYRATHPFYNLIYPEMNVCFVESMLTLFEQRGLLCTNDYGQCETWCMIGNHTIPVLAEAYKTGVMKDKKELAAKAIYTSLTTSHPKSNWEMYEKYGYYPYELQDVECVSRTLEHSYDDYCASEFYKFVGDSEKEAYFKKRSNFYQTLFDKSTLLMRPKDAKGNWRTPFDPFLLSHASTSGGDYTEGNAWQYTWHVQHDIPWLVEAMGGPDIFEAKLDSFFVMDTRSLGGGFHGDVTGMIGQYAHGNEPSHHVAYLYNYTKSPYKTQDLIRQVFDEFYFPTRDGLSGNDDCGQMSTWYIFSALGFYPIDPVSGQYIIGAPQVKEMKIQLPEGKVFEMVAHNLSAENKYVKSIKLNGQPLNGFVITFDQVRAGGKLEFEMSATH